jgi:hypothetical protein
LDHRGQLPDDWCRDAAAAKAYERWLRDDERSLQLKAAEGRVAGEDSAEITNALHMLREFPPLPG